MIHHGYGGGVAMREIRLLGDPILRTVADPVGEVDASLRRLVTDLMDTMTGRPGRAGVAAPQIGVGLRVFVFQAEGRRGHVVNPTLELAGEEVVEEEGCLSLPGLWFPTPRAARATVRGIDQDGRPVTISGSGALARVLQHEYDHLDGVLYVDRLRGETRRRALREIRAAPWAQR